MDGDDQAGPGGGPDAGLRPYQAEAAQVAGHGVIVVLVPSIALAAQMITAWPADCPVDQVLAVCPDDTIGGSGIRSADLTVPVSTDPELIAKWLADAPERVLVVGAYDPAGRAAEALRRAGQIAELTVCDEAHRLAGPVGKTTAAILFPNVMPERRRLYLTATPRIGTGTSAGGELLVTSMDDETVFGPVLYSNPFRKGIAEGLLKEYRIVVAALADSQVRELLDGDPHLVGDSGVPVRIAAAQAARAMTAARVGPRRCLTFVPRVAQTRQFAATLAATVRLLPSGRRPFRRVLLRWHVQRPARAGARPAAAPARRTGRPKTAPVRKKAIPGHTTLTQKPATAPPNLPEPPR